MDGIYQMKLEQVREHEQVREQGWVRVREREWVQERVWEQVHQQLRFFHPFVLG